MLGSVVFLTEKEGGKKNIELLIKGPLVITTFSVNLLVSCLNMSEQRVTTLQL